VDEYNKELLIKKIEPMRVKECLIRKQKGVTLIEILVAVFIGSLAVLGIYRLFSSSLRSYNLQEQMSGMYQNSTYTIKKISEILMQAGADLPQKNYTILFAQSSNPDNFRIRVNPNGSKYKFTSNLIDNDKIIMADASAFFGCDSLVRDSADTFSTIGHLLVYEIDTVKVLPAANDTIILKSVSNAKFYAGTTIFGYKSVLYYFDLGNVYCKDTSGVSIVTDNMDTVRIIYYDKNHATTTTWSQMISALVYVRSRTSVPDPKYKCPGYNDGYRRLPMSTEVRFRNKF
jgi:prepilin-type N-terminal cleavage/methylation domain-containing protein